jgi:hypothetical protein
MQSKPSLRRNHGSRIAWARSQLQATPHKYRSGTHPAAVVRCAMRSLGMHSVNGIFPIGTVDLSALVGFEVRWPIELAAIRR